MILDTSPPRRYLSGGICASYNPRHASGVRDSLGGSFRAGRTAVFSEERGVGRLDLASRLGNRGSGPHAHETNPVTARLDAIPPRRFCHGPLHLNPWHILLIGIAGWMNREQVTVIEYLKEENRVLPELLEKKRLRLNDEQRRRLLP